MQVDSFLRYHLDGPVGRPADDWRWHRPHRYAHISTPSGLCDCHWRDALRGFGQSGWRRRTPCLRWV